MDTSDDLVAGLLGLGRRASRGLLARVAEAVSRVFVPEIDQGWHAQLGCDTVERVGQAVPAGAGDVVLATRADRRDPDRPAVRSGDDLYVPAVMPVLARLPQVHAVGAGGRAPVGADLWFRPGADTSAPPPSLPEARCADPAARRVRPSCGYR
ncbi:hypothetical protein GCM10027162_74860 [Streptomyces incanus]